MKKKRSTFSKKLVSIVMILAIEVIIYSEIAMLITRDLSALPVLITAVVATVISAVVSMLEKSKKENMAGGIVYEAAMRDSSTHLNDEPTDYSVG